MIYGTGPLLWDWSITTGLVHYYAVYAIQKVHFVIAIISLGCHRECYNNVAVYGINHNYYT